MTIEITKKTADFSVAPQVSINDIADIAAAGFKTIISFRPDNEGGAEQPLAQDIKLAAQQHGLQFYYIPVVPNNIQPEQIATFNAAFSSTVKPALGFCKSGNRAAKVFELSTGSASTGNAPARKGMIAWLKSKCLITKLIRAIKQKAKN